MGETVGGIAMSWFDCWNEVCRRIGSKAVLISYGVDTRKVVVNTVPDERLVGQIVINFDMWGERDMKAFKALFASEDAPSANTSELSPPPPIVADRHGSDQGAQK